VQLLLAVAGPHDARHLRVVERVGSVPFGVIVGVQTRMDEDGGTAGCDKGVKDERASTTSGTVGGSSPW